MFAIFTMIELMTFFFLSKRLSYLKATLDFIDLNKDQDCWIGFDDLYYDVTKSILKHNLICRLCDFFYSKIKIHESVNAWPFNLTWEKFKTKLFDTWTNNLICQTYL